MKLVLAGVVAVALVVPVLGCPEQRKEAVEQVGGAPKDQVDVAKERLKKAEGKLQQNADAAAAAHE